MVNAIMLPQNCQRIRVLVADHTRMGSQLLGDALKRCHDLDVVDTAASSHEVLTAASKDHPHVTVISANLDEEPLRGFKVSRELRASYSEIKVVMLLDSSKRDLVVEAFRAGATGVFCRNESIKALCKCIHCVQKGQFWANSNEMRFVLEALADRAPMRLVDAKGTALLSKREQDVILCVAEGLTNREIAEHLKLSEHTVKNYLFRIFDKLGVSSRVEMILYAFSQRASAQKSSITSEQGSDFPQNGAAGFKWYRKAAEQGFDVAQYMLGQMYRDGQGVPKDKVSAYMWFLLAEHTGNELKNGSKEAKDRLSAKMKIEQIAEAQRRASEWLREHPEHAKLAALSSPETDKNSDQVPAVR